MTTLYKKVGPQDLSLLSPILFQSEFGPRYQIQNNGQPQDRHSSSQPISIRPQQFMPNVWLGNTSAISDPDFMVSNNIKFVIACVDAADISQLFLENRHCDLEPPDHCVVVVDSNFSSTAAISSPKQPTSPWKNKAVITLVMRFISKYNSILNAIMATSSTNVTDITSPVITIKDKLSLIENISNLINSITQNIPQTGILILHDSNIEHHKRRSVLLAVSYIIHQNPKWTVLDALLLMKNLTPVVDDLYLNNINFFGIADQYRLNVNAHRRFRYARTLQSLSLKRNISVASPKINKFSSSASSSSISSSSPDSLPDRYRRHSHIKRYHAYQ